MLRADYNLAKGKTCQKKYEYHGRNGRKMNVDSESKKTWGAHLNDFKVWYEGLSEEEKPHACDLLAQTDWSDYSWCWWQCHAASAILCGTPNV